MKTMQEMFDKMLNHLRQQGEPAYILDTGCRYRLQDGERTLSCAVGCLIDDDEYSSDMEGGTAESGAVLVALENSGVGDMTDEEVRFLLMCQQRMHDYPARSILRDFLTGAEEGAQLVAKKFHLTYTPPAEVAA